MPTLQGQVSQFVARFHVFVVGLYPSFVPDILAFTGAEYSKHWLVDVVCVSAAGQKPSIFPIYQSAIIVGSQLDMYACVSADSFIRWAYPAGALRSHPLLPRPRPLRSACARLSQQPLLLFPRIKRWTLYSPAAMSLVYGYEECNCNYRVVCIDARAKTCNNREWTLQ